MELRHYWSILRRWLWLIVLATLLAAAAAYFVSVRQTPIYQASTRLLVTPASSGSPTLTYSDLLISERLSRTYTQLLLSRPVLEATIARLGLIASRPEDLARIIVAEPVRDTQLIALRVEHPSPALAAELANTVPQVFQEFNNAQQSARFQESKSALEQQLASLGDEVRATEAALRAAADEPGNESQRAILENRLTQYRTSYSNILAQLEQIRLAEASALDTVTMVEPATAPTRPVRPRVLFNTLLAALVGLMLGLGVAFLIEYLDDTVKHPDEIAALVGLSTLGVISRLRHDKGQDGIVTVEQPRSQMAEAFRAVRTGVQFYGVDRPLRTLVVTSTGPEEGKSTTAANLAVVMAQAGKRVVLVDADLRRPVQHKRWGLPNTVGLTGALLEGAALADGAEQDISERLLAATRVANLWVLTCGQIPPNPSELLGSARLRKLADRLLAEFDILVFDSPPALAVTDAVVLSQAMDGVLLVVESGVTRAGALVQVVAELQRVNAHVVGVVLNKYQARQSGYYYDYKGYYAEEEGAGDERERGQRRARPASVGQRLRQALRRS